MCNRAGDDSPDAIFDQNGPCEALIEGKGVSFDLAPHMDDAGLLMDGQVNDGRITGTWMLDSFAGSQPLGRFEAMRL